MQCPLVKNSKACSFIELVLQIVQTLLLLFTAPSVTAEELVLQYWSHR